MVPLILVFMTSFFVVLYSTPPLIKVAILKRLFDEPGERKIHTRVVPTVGGVIIFAATLFSFSLWFNLDFNVHNLIEVRNLETLVNEFKLIVATSLVLFFVGIKDDIIGTSPLKKLVAHVLVGLILVLIGNIRISSLHGILEFYELPYWGSVFLSLFTYIVVVNAMNLIDGVDGLAGGVGFIISCSYATWFFFANNYVYASLSVALAGSLLGFLMFNFSPAKLFMGDSGSLTIGLIICFLSIKIIEYPMDQLHGPLENISKPLFVIASLIYPLTDTLRVFFLRAAKGISPFAADRNHLHHRLIDCGLKHRGTVYIIYGFIVFIILLTASLQFLNQTILLALIIAITALSVWILCLISKNKTVKKANIIKLES